MRHTGASAPITAYTIPPSAPEAVREAYAEFERLGALYEQTRAELKKARAAVTEAQAEDVRMIVDATTAGKTVADLHKHEAEAQARVADVETLLRGHTIAADEAGNRLLGAIAEHRGEWLAALALEAEEAAARYDAALREAASALAALSPARGGHGWLQAFDPDQARAGRVAQFAGGRIRVEARRGQLRGDFDPLELLLLARQVTEQPNAREVAAVA